MTTCTVRAKGLKKIQLKEIVAYYFENKRRSGGGQIKSFVPIESDEDIFEITFDNEKDAKSVAERRHVINGVPIEVSLLSEDVKTAFYQDRFLLTGLQKNTSDECLLYFINTKTRLKPKYLVYHKDAIGVALVIMKSDFDISQLLEDCIGETLEGAKIQILEVEVSKVIHVCNLPENTHNDTIMLYFENSKRSKGGVVENVCRLDETSCLVYFEDYEVVEGLLTHSHVLNERTLIVKNYFQCVALTEEEAICKCIPEPVFVSDLDIRKLKFIQENDRFRQTIEREFLSQHAQIEWPHESSENCKLKINCIIDTSIILSNRVNLRWRKEIKEIFDSMMNKIYIHSITLGECNIDDFCVECTAGNGEELLISTDRGANMITIVGTSQKLASTLKSVCTSSGDADDEMMEDRVSVAHAVELQMLKSLGYEDKLAKKLPHILVKESEDHLTFKGQPLDIRTAKLYILEMKNEFYTAFAYFATALASQLYSKKPIIDFVNENLQATGLQCIWSVSDKKLTTCCLKSCDLEECIDVIKTSVVDDFIDLQEYEVDDSDMCLVQTKVDKLVTPYPGKVAISYSGNYAVHMCSTKDIRTVLIAELKATIQNMKKRKKFMSKVVKNKCSTERHADRKSLRMSPYFECEGGAIWNTETHVVKVPDPIHVQLESNYLTFLKRKSCAKLVANLEKNNCSLEFTDKGINLHCTLKTKMTGFVAKQWVETSSSIVDKYISENIIERLFRSTEQVWNELIEIFNSENINAYKEVVTVVDSVAFNVSLIGFNDQVNDLLSRLEDMQAHIEKQHKKKTETIRDISDLKLRLLKTAGVFEDLKHNLQDIEIYIGDGELTIEGQPEDIIEVRTKLFELDNQISHKQWSHHFSRECVFFVNNVLNYKICSLLRRENITAVWKIDNKVFDVYIFEDEVNDYEAICENNSSFQVCLKAKKLLQSAIVEMKEPVQDSIFEVLTSPGWNLFHHYITETYETAAKLEVKDNIEILVHGMKKEAVEIHTRMKEFLDKNVIIRETLIASTVNIRFIRTHRQDFVTTTERKLDQHKVKIKLRDDFIKIIGNNRGIMEAKKEFKIFFDAILCDIQNIQKISVKIVFKDHIEQGTIEKIEKETSCLIRIPGESPTFAEPGEIANALEDSDDGYKIQNYRGGVTRSCQVSGTDPNKRREDFENTPKNSKTAFYNAHADGIHIGKIKLSVFKDDILSQITDAIVSIFGNAEDNELNKRCPEIEQECQKQENVYKLETDGVVMTKGHQLPAKHIIHVKFAENIGDWQERIFKCLETANKKHLKSIAFPILGTGKGFKIFSPEAITGCFFDAVNDFIQKTRSPSIKEILLIVYRGQPAMYTPVMDKLHKKVQEAITTGYVGKAKGMVKAAMGKIKKVMSDAITGREEGTMSEQDMQKLLQETSSLDVLIYSDSKTNIERCKKALELELEKSYTKKKIEDYKEIIKTLKPHELDQLDITALANINIDNNAGIITIEGPSQHVSNVLHTLQMRLLKIERQRNEASSDEELYKVVQWQYEEVTEKGFEYTVYEKVLNQKIENAYKANSSTFEFEDNDGETFVIDFNKLEEYKKSDDQDRLRVVRKDILKAVASALPEEWADMKDNENIKVVSVPNTDKEYQDIETRFIQEVKTGSYSHRLNFNPNNLKVNKIERIQNRTLYQQYQAKKNQMKELKPNLPATLPYERDLWHGTKYDAVTSIQMHGFNRSYSGNANGDPWYGEGVYFAGNASYSARGWLSGAGAGSKGYMFVVKTLTGQLCQGKKGMRYLPQVDPKDPTILYDCAVDNLQNPLEFVIFNDTQAYPAYIITFTT